MLKNECLLAKIGIDTAENDPEIEVSSTKYACTAYVGPSLLPLPTDSSKSLLWRLSVNDLTIVLFGEGVGAATAPTGALCAIKQR